MASRPLRTPTQPPCLSRNFSLHYSESPSKSMAVADLTLEGLVHDLNNVFQTIAESAELLEEDPRWEKLAHTLQRSAGRGHRIAHSILESNRSALELAPIIENASQFCQDYWDCANRTNMQFCSEVDPDFRLKGDAADRKSTRLNSSHSSISYAVFC